MKKVFVDLKELGEQPVRFIDTRFDLANAQSGQEMYDEEHIEGAIYWDLVKDLSDMDSDAGRHPMISKEKMKNLVQTSGLSLDDFIVIYDQGASPFALRAYFLLEWAGFSSVQVLREGYEEAKKVLSVSNEVSNFPETKVELKFNENISVDMEHVRKVVSGEADAQLIDARAAKRFRGEIEPIDPIAGHIPTAINFDWEQLKNNGKFLPQDLLKDKLNGLTDKSKPVIAYCGSGVTAAPLYASLKEAGYENIQLYVGSYSDWIRENDVETSN